MTFQTSDLAAGAPPGREVPPRPVGRGRR